MFQGEIGGLGPLEYRVLQINVFSVATEGKEFRYGSVRMPVDLWGPWRDVDCKQSLGEVEKAAASMLRPAMVLDMLGSFTAFATEKGKHRIKIIARYQQVDGVNKIVTRVVSGQPRKGLIWHFQGSGKSLLMLFAARKLRLHALVRGPTMRCLSEGNGKGDRTAAWCSSPKSGDVSCAMVRSGTVLRWARYWGSHRC